MRENEFQEQVEEAYRIKGNEEDAERQTRVSIVISNYYFVVT